MRGYGTKQEIEPILPQVHHPEPGEGGWGEHEWIGAVSHAKLRRPFLDPVLYAPGDDDEDKEAKFKYLKETKVVLRELFASKFMAFRPQTLFLYSLLGVAILMDGVRPITLVWAKGDGNKYPFMFAVWVVLVKIITVIFSVTMWYIARRRGELQSTLSVGKRLALSVYFVVPVLCYVWSDVLNFVLFEHRVSPTLFACIKQSRIVLTALMYRFLLHKNVSPIQWIAVFQLCLASILFVAEDTSKPVSNNQPVDQADELKGIMWLLFKFFLDSVAVVWMDKYFKTLDESGFPYAEQQVMFSLQSLVAGALFIIVYNRNDFFGGRPLFDGFNQGAWVSALITGVYGIMVSLVLRYLDSMIKQFQALCGIVVTTLLDEAVFGQVVTLTDWVAICIILISVFLYKLGAAPGKSKV